MIDVTKYNLVYFCKETGKEVRAFIPETGVICILDDGAVTRYTSYQARKRYRGSRDNRKSKSKAKYTRPKMARRCGYEEYLNETVEKYRTVI